MKAIDILTLTADNIDHEHVGCALPSGSRDPAASKKSWMKQEFLHGYRMKRFDIRGKVLLEYTPAEYAWAPIDAPGYLFLDCFWVSGRYQGHGYARRLLETAIADAKAEGRCGLVAISSDRKRPFLSDPGFYRHMGFRFADRAAPYFELIYLPFDEDADTPAFRVCAKEGVASGEGLAIYYSDHCPYTGKYLPKLVEIAERREQPLQVHKFTHYREAQASPCPFTTFAFYDDGHFVTHEILSEQKFAAYLEGRR